MDNLLTLADLAELLNGVLHGDASHAISALSSLTRATPDDIVYFDNPSLLPVLQKTAAGVVLLKVEYRSFCPVNALVVADPLTAMIKVSSLLSTPSAPQSQIHASAQIHPSVQLGRNCSVGAYVVIGEGATLGDDAVVGEHSIIAPFVRIGAQSTIGSAVILHEGTYLGDQVVIHSGAILGAAPFNYLKQHGVWEQSPVLGGVTLADQVHIGANTVLDRGTVGDTYLAQGVRVDNLVHIAHDVFIGSNTAVAGGATLGAHVRIGADCILGGASCVAAFVHLADDVVISGMSTVSKSIKKAGIYSSGTLAHEHQRWRRNAARFRRLDDYIVRLGILERKTSNDL